jgi:uncharacterized protein affecting Mg2+/Co2+ transport
MAFSLRAAAAVNAFAFAFAAAGKRLPAARRLLHSTAWVLDLEAIGVMQAVQAQPYAAGQFFVHRLLGYRGVVVTPWKTDLFKYPELPAKLNSPMNSMREIRSVRDADVDSNARFYQVICDSRDARGHKRTEMGTMTGTHVGHKQGFDYVDHADILPYTPVDPINAFEHENFVEFFMWPADVPEPSDKVMVLQPTQALLEWQQAALKRLKSSSVFRAKSHDIQITVIPTFDRFTKESAQLSYRPYVWYYKVMIENLGRPVQLHNRIWHIRDDKGAVDIISGKGVISFYPKLQAEDSAFQYTSFVNIGSNFGYMGGHYGFNEILSKENRGPLFDVEIPTVALKSPGFTTSFDDDP